MAPVRSHTDVGPLDRARGRRVLIGATGTFSPCGLSVIDTIGPTGHTGGRRITVAACATFLPGAIAGGLLTFGSLACSASCSTAPAAVPPTWLAAAIALVAAVLEARGTRIVPQIRRQLPEHWRRVMPMPLAAALYGVLLGLGFTTFVLSFGVWALAGVSLAVGDPTLGLLLGAAFGLGRAIPIVVLAPLAGQRAGHPRDRADVRAATASTSDCAAATPPRCMLVGPRPGRRSRQRRGAAVRRRPHATDPAATADALLFQRLGGPAVISRGGPEIPLPGKHPAIGGRYVATVTGDADPALDRDTPGAGRVDRRARRRRGRRLGHLARLPRAGRRRRRHLRPQHRQPGLAGAAPLLAGEGAPPQLSPPAVDGNILLFAIATPRGSRIVQQVLGTHKHRALVRSRRLLLFDPAVNGRSFVYVRSDARRSRLMVRGRHGTAPGASSSR